jgi:O-antigen/teichoic acid export membrane protein
MKSSIPAKSAPIENHRSSGVVRDVTANLVGRAWATLLSVILVPVFIRYLGVEAYGLVGFFVTLQSILVVLDFGFSTTLNHAVARQRKQGLSAEVLSLADILDKLFIVLAMLIALVVSIGATWLSNHWVRLDELDSESVSIALRLMGVAIALYLPFMLYAGGLVGLGRQTYMNVILSTGATLRFGGALLVLEVMPSVEAFFAWQAFATAVQTLWCRASFFRTLRAGKVRSAPARGVLRRYIRFATGVGLTAGLGVVLTQLDKLILSRLLSLEEYGYYMLAWTLASLLFLASSPVVTTFFPRLSARVHQSDAELRTLYHSGMQLLVVAVMPVASILLVFSDQLLFIWLSDQQLASNLQGLVSALAMGTLLNTLVQMPHALQLAYGLPQFGMYANMVLVVVVAPAYYLATIQYGTEGAAWVWVTLNAAYAVIGVPLMHRWVLRGELLHWLVRDLLIPATAVFTISLGSRHLMNAAPETALVKLALIGVCYLAAFAAALSVLPGARAYLWRLRPLSGR